MIVGRQILHGTLCAAGIGILHAFAYPTQTAHAEEEPAESPAIVEYRTSDNVRIEAALFETDATRAVVLAHGAVFNKESWYPLARRLRNEGVTVLSINFRGYGGSETATRQGDLHLDVLGAVKYLADAGYDHVALVGGSMGAGAILRAMEARTPAEADRIVILAGAGPPIRSEKIVKLFIATEGDPIGSAMRETYATSSDPKTLSLLEGSAHAQHIFKTDQGEELTRRIVQFVASNEE